MVDFPASQPEQPPTLTIQSDPVFWSRCLVVAWMDWWMMASLTTMVLLVQKSGEKTTGDVENLVNNGMYQPQLVSLPDF